MLSDTLRNTALNITIRGGIDQYTQKYILMTSGGVLSTILKGILLCIAQRNHAERYTKRQNAEHNAERDSIDHYTKRYITDQYIKRRSGDIHSDRQIPTHILTVRTHE